MSSGAPIVVAEANLYSQANGSDKVYHIRIETDPAAPRRYRVPFAFGKRGGTLQSGDKAKEPMELAHALREFETVVEAKCSGRRC